MASESDEGASILEQMMRGGSGGRGLGFFPILLGLMGRPTVEGEGEAEAPLPDRIVLVNPLTQGMVVLQGDAALVSEILLEGGGRRGPPPASKASIEAMRTVEAGEVEADKECPVCLDGLGGDGGEGKEGEAEAEEVLVKEMPCRHRFHAGCIEKWLGMHGSCPVCRFQMPIEEAAEVKKAAGEEEEEEDDEEGDEERRRRGRREVWITISIGGRRIGSDEEQAGDGGEAREAD